MKNGAFQYDIKVEVTFLPNDLLLLLHAAERHYSGHEVAASLNSALCHLEDPSGEWSCPEGTSDTWAAPKLMTFFQENPDVISKIFLSFRELDTLAKVMEYYGTARQAGAVLKSIGISPPNEPDQGIIDGVYDGLRAAMGAINARYIEVRV